MYLLTGWTKEIFKRIKRLNKDKFELKELYQFIPELKEIYPRNNYIEQKIQQQVQVLEQNGYLERTERGRYRIVA